MRLRAILFAVVVLAGAVWSPPGRWPARATAWFERATAAELDGALDAAGLDWAEVAIDGLKVTLSGAAPDETGRFRAPRDRPPGSSPSARITDATTVAAAAPLRAPGLRARAPAQRGRDLADRPGARDRRARRDPLGARRRRARRATSPTCWRRPPIRRRPAGARRSASGSSVLAELPRAKVSVAPGAVGVIAVADSDPERAALEARLAAARRRRGSRSTLDISAPRPVIAPFAFDASLRGRRAYARRLQRRQRRDAAARIAAAAQAAGLAGDGRLRGRARRAVAGLGGGGGARGSRR